MCSFKVISFLVLLARNSAQKVKEGDQVYSEANKQSGGNQAGISRRISSESIKEGGVEYNDIYIFNKKGDYASVTGRGDGYEQVSTFCYTAVPPSLSLYWSSASMKMDLSSNNYQVYIGPNVTAVMNLVKDSQSAWIYSQLPWRAKDFKISPFENACISVQTAESFTITLQWKHLNYMLLAGTLCGMALFYMAPTLCRNTFFHYTTGISVGLLMSVILLTYLLQRRFKQSIFSWVGFAYSLSVYLMTRTWFNIKEYMTEQYIHLVVGYVVIGGIISFAVVYRMGPPSDHRTLNLIQWSMQFIALLMVSLSSYNQPASFLLIILMIIWSAIPAKVKSGVNTQIRKRFFKPKIKLLTEDEYNTQAHEETRKALEELKAYCRSPESKPWQTVSRLRSPRRFAEFIEGSPHLTEAEVMEYSHWDYNTDDDAGENDLYTDDDEDADEAASDENRD